jgi:predicted transcriptional regulator
VTVNELVEKASVLRAEGKTQAEIAEKLGRSMSAVSLYLNPERLLKHRERSKAFSRKWRQENPDLAKSRAAKWQSENREKVNARQRRYWANNLDRKRQYQREYYRAYFEKNPSRERAHILRCALIAWMLGTSRKRRDGLNMSDVVGCTPAEFRAHLESQFTGAMTWDTWGSEWEIDHIRPLVGFDMLDDAQAKVAMHWSNTRPVHPSVNRGRERREKLIGPKGGFIGQKEP